MAGKGAPIGNDYGAKAKEFLDRVRKLCVQEDWKRLEKAANQLLDKAANGESWAIQMLADKFDGKATQPVEGKIDHSVTHEHRTVSETSSWLAEVIGTGAAGSPEKPVSH